MKRLTIIAGICVCSALALPAAETKMRYDTDRTFVADAEKADEDHDHSWKDYKANEVNFSFYGTGTVGKKTLLDISGDKVERDGKLGLGAGLSYFFCRYAGIEGYAYSESTGGDHFVDNVGGDLIGRWPIGHSGFAPYIFGGGGGIFGGGQKQVNERFIEPGEGFDILATTGHTDAEARAIGQVGGGMEIRITPHIGWVSDFSWNFVDGPNNNFGMVRTGVNFAF